MIGAVRDIGRGQPVAVGFQFGAVRLHQIDIAPIAAILVDDKDPMRIADRELPAQLRSSISVAPPRCASIGTPNRAACIAPTISCTSATPNAIVTPIAAATTLSPSSFWRMFWRMNSRARVRFSGLESVQTAADGLIGELQRVNRMLTRTPDGLPALAGKLAQATELIDWAAADSGDKAAFIASLQKARRELG